MLIRDEAKVLVGLLTAEAVSEPSLVCTSQEVRQAATAFKWFCGFVPWAADSELKISVQEFSEGALLGLTPVGGIDKGLGREKSQAVIQTQTTANPVRSS